jgi:hypothetical protein
MRSIGLGTLILLAGLYGEVALAETCDAGHDCKITCANGCGAIYWIESGTCSKFCSEPEKPSASLSPQSFPNTDMPEARMDDARMSGFFYNATKDDIAKALAGSETKQ